MDSDLYLCLSYNTFKINYEIVVTQTLHKHEALKKNKRKKTYPRSHPFDASVSATVENGFCTIF